MQRRCRSVRLGLQPLESRLAPASSLWVDGDGDRVLFDTSTGDLGGRITQSFPNAQGVFSVDLTGPGFAGTSLTVSVTRGKAGDGRAIVGHIRAGGNDLGAVRVQGDLGDIDAGSGSATVPAVRSLTVASMGRFGQRGDGDNYAFFTGAVGSLVVQGDLNDTYVRVGGNLASALVGGSLIGGAGGDGGEIYATGSVGRVTIRHDIRGGAGAYSGSVGAGVNVGSVLVGGSVYGGSGDQSGTIVAGYLANGRIGKVTLGGSLVGGSGLYSGLVGGVGTYNVALRTVLIGRDIIGGGGDYAGSVYGAVASLSLERLAVKGSLVGGAGVNSGYVQVDSKSGTVTITGSVYGGSGIYSGGIEGNGGLDGLTIGGSLVGGPGDDSAKINVPNGGLAVLRIRGDLRGGVGTRSARVDVGAAGIATKVIGGAVIPGIGMDSGTVVG